jgi:undecaprenyl-diphosphatase
VTVPFEQLVVLAVVQGLTEFLPVSSSGHLILVPILTGWPDQGIEIDVATHVGTLAAVLIYFWRDVARMATGLVRFAAGRRDPGAKLVGYLIVGTIPALIVGLIIEKTAGTAFRHLEAVAWTMVAFGVVLFFADRFGLTIRRMDHLTIRQVIVIGLAQCLAFVPGTSRSGITMVAARILGYERVEAARFSFLLSIPAISAAGLWEGLKIYQSGSAGLIHDAVVVAAMSAVVGVIAIAGLIWWLRHASFLPFVVYRLVFGCGMLGWIYFLN